MIRLFFTTLILVQTAFPVTAAASRSVTVKDNHLVVDGQKQPQLFGAEVQYFRLRGGYGPNIPRETVLALWNKALDHFVDAKMNAISFYIPWDFHEYAEGQFDFSGTVDQDGDGKPDYPSRDLKTFFKLIKDRGITRIMVRPGPYINAEWGFLGFGAIPEWFHNKYPDSHMQNSLGKTAKLYDYHNADLLRHTEQWFKALHTQVLRHHMGPKKPIVFLQLDNETNFQWQSIYNLDYSPNTLARYQEFLKSKYGKIDTLNQSHGRIWERWTQIQAPTHVGRNLKEDQDWYRFADDSIYTYLIKIRNIWKNLGVQEPQVLMTLAESYNAPANGILPHYILRNAPRKTGLMTVNLYPKTSENPTRPLFDFPFKADLDVKSADEASDLYLGSRQEWVLGPEIQGGWWRGINVTPEARLQTYLTVIGHGMKALFVYYFNEGQNWDAEWAHNQLKPLFEKLKRERGLEKKSPEELNDAFWMELQTRSDRSIIAGLDVRKAIKLGQHGDDDLFFDAPLDKNANPGPHFQQLKLIGERVIHPFENFLARSLAALDEVAIVKDNASHAPSPDSKISSVEASADWNGGLLGLLLNSNINPQILFSDISSGLSFQKVKALFHLDTGVNATETTKVLKDSVRQGKIVINYLADDIAKNLGFGMPSKKLINPTNNKTSLVFYLDSKDQIISKKDSAAKSLEILSSDPLYTYDLSAEEGKNCEGILYYQSQIVGYRCKVGSSFFIQIGALLFKDFNSTYYGDLSDALQQRIFLNALVGDLKLNLKLSDNQKMTVAFARKDPKKELVWITVKTGAREKQNLTLMVSPQLLKTLFKASTKPSELDKRQFTVMDIIENKKQTISGADLVKKGFEVNLKPNGSTVFVLQK